MQFNTYYLLNNNASIAVHLIVKLTFCLPKLIYFVCLQVVT